MPPSLRVSVGTPVTDTASFMVTVSVMVLPALRLPLPATMPVPLAASDSTDGAVVSTASTPAGL